MFVSCRFSEVILWFFDYQYQLEDRSSGRERDGKYVLIAASLRPVLNTR